jgi:hypothetical protein
MTARNVQSFDDLSGVEAMVSPSPQNRIAATKVKGCHLTEVVHAPVAPRALT